MVAIREHPVQWTTAAPVWPAEAGAAPTGPALLRFYSDTFMDDLLALLRADPAKLSEHIARSESFRPPPIGTNPNDWRPLAEGGVTKLYQPVHGQFSLVAASLVCRTPGLPDRAVRRPAEKAGFVVRKLADDGGELAWVTDPRKTWQAISSGREGALALGEEVFPLFPVAYTDTARRCLLVGLIPTSSRESFQAAPDKFPTGSEPDPRLTELEYRVLEPLKSIRDAKAIPAPSGSDPQVLAQTQAEATMFLLLDFADVLKKNGIGWIDGAAPTFGQASWELYDLLLQAKIDRSASWLDAVKEAWRQRGQITGENPVPPGRTFSLWNAGDNLDAAKLADLFEALMKLDTKPLEVAANPNPVPKFEPGSGVRYVVRCVYQRPECRPPHADLVSKKSAEFTIAPFFDFDAPSRPVRIPLPVDTSLAGLRKFTKNVAFLTSAKLRQQMSQVTDLNKALKGELSAGGSFTLGEICSFSLPIITICAMILLIGIIIVLNIVFWWLPIFRLCFPIPVKK